MKKYLQLKFALILAVASMGVSCNQNQQATIQIDVASPSADTLYFSQLMTDVPLGQLAMTSDGSYSVTVENHQVVVAQSTERSQDVLLLVAPGKTNKLVIDSSGIRSLSRPDTLLKYFSTSSNATLGKYNQLIFTDGSERKIYQAFDSLRQARKEIIENAGLGAKTTALLRYQSKAQVYNFLFFYGRMLKNLAPEDEFFKFTSSISLDEFYLRTFPQILLYKFEIDYLKAKDSIESVMTFADYIDNQVINQDDADFLRAFYIKELIESPQYWKKHNQVFNSIELKKIMAKEATNPYNYLFESGSQSYFSAMRGQDAYDFAALKADSSSFKLRPKERGLIVIDVWATWCGPCIQQKPYFEQTASQFENQPVTFLSVSTDDSFAKWKRYMDRNTFNEQILELNVSLNNDAFKKGYNVQSIPRYVLIGPNGKIIDADMEDPGNGMVRRIKSELQ